MSEEDQEKLRRYEKKPEAGKTETKENNINDLGDNGR
jgi:hypothetical protein